MSKQAGVVTETMRKSDNRVVYYMLHKGASRETSLTIQLRVVFDASSVATGYKSLNDCLEIGPNLNPELLAKLLRFRWHALAITSDIEKRVSSNRY